MQTNPTNFPSVFFTYQSIVKNEGVAALWKGAVPTSMGMVAENAMAFGVNEALKRTFPDEAKEDPTKRPDLVKPFLMVSLETVYILGLLHLCLLIFPSLVLNMVHLAMKINRGQSLDAVQRQYYFQVKLSKQKLKC